MPLVTVWGVRQDSMSIENIEKLRVDLLKLVTPKMGVTFRQIRISIPRELSDPQVDGDNGGTLVYIRIETNIVPASDKEWEWGVDLAGTVATFLYEYKLGYDHDAECVVAVADKTYTASIGQA